MTRKPAAEKPQHPVPWDYRNESHIRHVMEAVGVTWDEARVALILHCMRTAAKNRAKGAAAS